MDDITTAAAILGRKGGKAGKGKKKKRGNYKYYKELQARSVMARKSK